VREEIQVGFSSLLALILSGFLGIGVPPSEFVQEPNFWLQLEFLMFPLLFAGVGLSVVALVLTPFTVRRAALTCLAATVASMAGVIIAWSIDAEATHRGIVLSAAVLSLPVAGALDIIRRLRCEK